MRRTGHSRLGVDKRRVVSSRILIVWLVRQGRGVWWWGLDWGGGSCGRRPVRLLCGAMFVVGLPLFRVGGASSQVPVVPRRVICRCLPVPATNSLEGAQSPWMVVARASCAGDPSRPPAPFADVFYDDDDGCEQGTEFLPVLRLSRGGRDVHAELVGRLTSSVVHFESGYAEGRQDVAN